jgi:hypothetical protein
VTVALCCICGLKAVQTAFPALRFYTNAAQVTFVWHVPCEVEHGWPAEAKP